MSATILICDDEPVQRRLLENALNRFGFRTLLSEDGESALGILGGSAGTSIDLLILDLSMPGMNGMDVLAEMSKQKIHTPVIVQTAQAGIDTVIAAMRAGASDFCVKPVSPERLKVSVQNALKVGAMEQVVQKVHKASTGTFTFDDMIADSTAMEKVLSLGRRAAASNIPVLIEGESGVGKEVVARAIQGESERNGAPFITVNCGALPENLVESILFGHEKGAFTGAHANHVGKFKEADGGTLFLDEIGELPLDIQVKLLRALQEGEIDPVGSKRPVKTNFRLISATNRNMVEHVSAGYFREDLYYRINVFPLMLPPLRARKSDIAGLVKHFTARFCLEEGRRNITGISRNALSMLEAHDWPGNIRQLENTIFRAVVLCDGTELTENEFPQIAAQLPLDNTAGDQIVRLDTASTAKAEAQEPPTANAAHLLMMKASGDVRRLDDVEAELIRFALDHHQQKMTKIASALGIGRSTLYRKLKELGLDEAPLSNSAA